MEAERRSPARLPARLRAVGQESSVRPQFQSQPLMGERLSRFYSRTRARQDRTLLRARVELRNSLLSNQTSSHLPREAAGFSFNFLVQH